MVEHQRQGSQQAGGNDIGAHDAVRAGAAAQNGNELGLLRHFGGEKYHGNEGEQRAEQVAVMRDEHQVIIKDDLLQRNFFGSKGLDLFLDVEYDKNEQDEGDGKEKSAEELPDDVSI